MSPAAGGSGMQMRQAFDGINSHLTNVMVSCQLSVSMVKWHAR